MTAPILALDVAGAPHRWINVREGAHYYATRMVAWAAGTHEFVLRGGVQRATGLQSQIRASSSIAIRGKDLSVRNFEQAPTLTKEHLLARDRHVCAYCAQQFPAAQLDVEHIVPSSKGAESLLGLHPGESQDPGRSNRVPAARRAEVLTPARA